MAPSRRSTSSLGNLLDQLNQPASHPTSVPGFPESRQSGTPGTQLSMLPETQEPDSPEIQEPGNPGIQSAVLPTSGESQDSKLPKATKKVTFEFDADFARALKVQSAAEGISMRDYVLRAIQYFQESRKPATQEARR